ncbi:MAG: hypothetical protein CfClM3_1002 [Methanobrevibacter sp. CfCl-M3]
MFRHYGSSKIVKERAGLTDNDPGSNDLIKYALIASNAYIHKYLANQGYCAMPPECDLSLDEAANLLALSKLEMDREYYSDDNGNAKSSNYKKEALEILDLYNYNSCEHTGYIRINTNTKNPYRCNYE